MVPGAVFAKNGSGEPAPPEPWLPAFADCSPKWRISTHLLRGPDLWFNVLP